MQLTKFHKTLLCIPPLTVISTNSIYKSWKELDDYELERENYKSTERKIEAASIGFVKGIFYGTIYAVFLPVILSGTMVASVHTLIKNKK